MKLSVLTLTYNHQDYLEECLESILNQKTNFDFEVLINDDASTDNTLKIVKHFQQMHPGKISLTAHKENQYSQGVRNPVSNFLIKQAKGQYIALCEGDDFWTDNSKLQKQVDFMDQNLDHSICFHPVQVYNETNPESSKDSFMPSRHLSGQYTLKMLLERNLIQTNSVVYRRQDDYSDLSLAQLGPEDWYLHIHHALKGKIGYLNEPMSAYRVHENGLWFEASSNSDNHWITHGYYQFVLYEKLLEITNGNQELTDVVCAHLDSAYKYLKVASDNTNSDALKAAVEATPIAISKLLDYRIAAAEALQEDINFLQSQISNRDAQLAELAQDIEGHKTFAGQLQTDIDSLNKVVTTQVAELASYKEGATDG